MSNDFNNSLSEVMDGTFINYKGCLIQKVHYGYEWSGTLYPALGHAERAIDISLEALQLSIQECKEREDYHMNKLDELDYKNDKP